MGFFKEKGDYVDYTILKKKGLLKDEEQPKSDVIDFTNTSGASVPVPSVSSAAGSGESNPFGFLDSMASASASSSSSGGSYYGNDTQTSQTNSPSDVNSLRIKVEDLEYKIEKLLEKIAKMEEKIGQGSV